MCFSIVSCACPMSVLDVKNECFLGWRTFFFGGHSLGCLFPSNLQFLVHKSLLIECTCIYYIYICFPLCSEFKVRGFSVFPFFMRKTKGWTCLFFPLGLASEVISAVRTFCSSSWFARLYPGMILSWNKGEIHCLLWTSCVYLSMGFVHLGTACSFYWRRWYVGGLAKRWCFWVFWCH